MKAISLWQPWATLMAEGFKRNETRHWTTNYRGPLLIHAAKRMEPLTLLMSQLLTPIGYKEWNDFPCGAIVCELELVDCIKTSKYIPGHPEFEFGDYQPGRFVWITKNVKKFDPIPFRGKQGFFNVPDEIANLAFNQAKRAV